MINMKKLKETVILSLKIAAVTGAIIYCFVGASQVREAVSAGIERCIYVIIPSLYAMMAVSMLMIRSGIVTFAAGSIDRIAHIIGLTGEELLIFLFSITAGYPVGTKMLCARGENISRSRTELLAGVCFGAGPAFISGCISHRLYGSDRIDSLLMLSCFTANIILVLVISPVLRRYPPPEAKHRRIMMNSDLLTECILSAGRSIGEICFMVTAFAIITYALEACGAVDIAGALLSAVTDLDKESAGAVLRSFLDVTAVEGFPAGDYRLLPWISALTSFGGVCVMLQIAAAASGKIRIGVVIPMRICAAFISFFVCRLLMPFMLRRESVSVSTSEVHIINSPSPIPSVLLIIMTLVLFREYGMLRKKVS